MTQKEQCRDLIERNNRVLERARAAAGGLTDTQVLWPPPDGGWSVGQVLEHLCRTCTRYLEGMRRYGDPTVEAPRGGDKPYRQSIQGMFLLQSLALFPKLPAPGALRPGAKPRPHALEFLLEYHRELGRLLEATAGLDWNRIFVSTPVSALVKLNLGDCFTALVVHAERHLGQIERLRERPEFPQ